MLYLLNEEDKRRLDAALAVLGGTAGRQPGGLILPQAGRKQAAVIQSPFRVQRLRIDTVFDDYLECHTWDGTTEGSTAINVAKPFKLRHVAGNYPNVSAVVTVNANAITATIGGDDEEWVLPDELTYTDNDEIYAIPVASTGVTVSSKDLKLLDMNVDGRAWIKEE